MDRYGRSSGFGEGGSRLGDHRCIWRELKHRGAVPPSTACRLHVVLERLADA